MGAGCGVGDSKLQGRSIYTELYVPPKATNVGVQLLAESAGVAAAIEGEAVRASAPGLKARWMADLSLREAGRSRT